MTDKSSNSTIDTPKDGDNSGISPRDLAWIMEVSGAGSGLTVLVVADAAASSTISSTASRQTVSTAADDNTAPERKRPSPITVTCGLQVARGPLESPGPLTPMPTEVEEREDEWK